MVSAGNWTNGTEADEGGRTPRLVFLALIMLLACGVNVLLLFAFVQNKKARQSVQSITCINLAAVCLADCVLNMSLVTGSLAAGQDWTFSESLCRWHSFVMSLVLVETSLLLTVLVCDRFLAVRYLAKYDSLISHVRLIIVLVFTWIQSLAFSIPFFVNTVKTTFQLKLHTCSVSDETSVVYMCMASVLCFLAPTFIIIVMFIMIFYTNHKQQHEVKMIVTQNHYCDQVKQEPALWKEMFTVRYVGVLCLFWLVLDIPYVITTYIQQYRFSSDLSFSMDYPWGVDVAFLWMRFSFSALFPCITFIWRKDLWHCCKERLICHRSNSVLDIKVTVDPAAKTAAGRAKQVVQSLKAPPKSKDREQPKAEVPNLLSFNVPVLFATSDGIHIETSYSDASEAEDADAESRHHLPKGRQLDVTSQAGDHDRLPGDTSDYDSETEYYSSQPLSTRHIRGAVEASSVPDLCNDHQHERGAPAHTGKLTSSQGADSGLELSGTVGSSEGKNIQQQTDSTKDTEDSNTPDTSDKKDSETPDTLDKKYSETPDNVDSANAPENSEGSVSTGDSPTQTSSTCSSTNAAHRISVVTEAQPDVRRSDDADPDLKTLQHCTPSSIPKVQGRLKPLNPARPPKSRPDWPERNITMKSEFKKNDGAFRNKPKPDIPGKSDKGSSIDKHTDNDTRVGGGFFQESRGRGHRRTVTSDSERALLSSDSSMEIQTVRTPGADADGEKKNGID